MQVLRPDTRPSYLCLKQKPIFIFECLIARPVDVDVVVDVDDNDGHDVWPFGYMSGALEAILRPN